MSWTGPAFTKVAIPPIPELIRYSDQLFFTGSCFSEHLAFELTLHKYKAFDNPFGILYNPVAIAKSFERIVDKIFYTEDDLVQHDGLYHSMDHHSSFSDRISHNVIGLINEHIKVGYDLLKESKFVFISPGTSWVYLYKPTNEIVGNCHKIPQSEFERSKMSVEECMDAFQKCYDLIKSVSPKAYIIWTVSPVRHLRDGLIENNKSKSALLVAMDEITKRNRDTFYFPAFEIMMDQLRDYRYYDADLVHPSEIAINIIWNLFREAYLDPSEIQLHSEIEKIRKGMHHRIMHNLPEARVSFAMKQMASVNRLAALIPGSNWEREIEHFSSLL